MNRGDMLAKLQSTSASETRTLSIADGNAAAAAAAAASAVAATAAALSIQNKSDANVLNAFDAQSVFKLISSANDLEQHNDSDRECDDIGKNDEEIVQLFDMQATTKNKRKNFKPRNAQTNTTTNTTIDADHHIQQQQQQQPSLTDQFILNLMMQNKMKQLQQELHQGQLRRWPDEHRIPSAEHLSLSSEHGEHRTLLNSDDSSNHITHIKSPPSSPLTNGHSNATGGKTHIHFILFRSSVNCFWFFAFSFFQEKSIWRFFVFYLTASHQWIKLINE